MDYTRYSDRQLLEIVIGTRATRRIYSDSLAELFKPQRKETCASRKMAAYRELLHRYLVEDLRRGPPIECPVTVYRYLQARFAGQEHESLEVLYLDTRHRLIATEPMFHGSINGASVHPREVVKRALFWNAAALILAHNHPSGVAEPSSADRMITERLRDALALVEVRLLDHVVVSGEDHVSLAERGWV